MRFTGHQNHVKDITFEELYKLDCLKFLLAEDTRRT